MIRTGNEVHDFSLRFYLYTEEEALTPEVYIQGPETGTDTFLSSVAISLLDYAVLVALNSWPVQQHFFCVTAFIKRAMVKFYFLRVGSKTVLFSKEVIGSSTYMQCKRHESLCFPNSLTYKYINMFHLFQLPHRQKTVITNCYTPYCLYMT